jgi:hypothetical protein
MHDGVHALRPNTMVGGITRMGEPLSKSQQKLRGHEIRVMTDEQLVDWIHACHAMENYVTHNKARRGWKQSGQKAEAEVNRRQLKKERADALSNAA